MSTAGEREGAGCGWGDHRTGSPPAVVVTGERTPWRDVAGAMLAARMVVLLALALAWFLRQEAPRTGLRGEGLLGWDARWYQLIADHGYGGVPHEALRFFPAYPLLGRGVSFLLLGSTAAALLVIANVAAGGYLVLLHRLAHVEGLGEAAARRAVWVATLAPAAFVLVMGYAEAFYGCLLTGCLLAVRTRHWAAAAVLGALTGATRPTGVLVVAFVAVESARALRSVGPRELALRVLALVAPLAGLGCYLAWVGHRFGDALLPFRIQTKDSLRGGVVLDPIRQVHEAVTALPDGQAVGVVAHLPWVALALVLLLLVARRLPLSYAVLAAVTLLVALTGQGFGSFERYAASCVPLVLAAATVRPPAVVGKGVLAMAGAVLLSYALLAFLHLYVP